jgi:hypothetical protein
MANNGSASGFPALERTVSPKKIEDVWSVMVGCPPQDFSPTSTIAHFQASWTCARCLLLFSTLVEDSI